MDVLDTLLTFLKMSVGKKSPFPHLAAFLDVLDSCIFHFCCATKVTVVSDLEFLILLIKAKFKINIISFIVESLVLTVDVITAETCFLYNSPEFCAIPGNRTVDLFHQNTCNSQLHYFQPKILKKLLPIWTLTIVV